MMNVVLHRFRCWRLLASAALIASSSCAPTGSESAQVVNFKAGDPVTNKLALLTKAAGVAPRRVTRPDVIGPEVDAEDYPWQVGLQINTGRPNESWACGGILISPDFVLTAAHCLDAADVGERIIRRVAPQMITIFHGDRWFGQGRRISADAAWGPYIHHGWKVDPGKPYAYDVGIIKLQSPIGGVTTAPIQRAASSRGNAVVSGWGRYDKTDRASETLRAAVVPLIENATCRAHLPQEAQDYVTDATLCTESELADACKGDSGGPLVVGSRARPQTVGVVSWGPSAHCTFRGPNNTMIGGYVRASAIGDWVRSSTGDARTVTSAPPEPLFALNAVRTSGGIDR